MSAEPDRPCPCLSGEQYKDCHGLLERACITASNIGPGTAPPEVILKAADAFRAELAKTADRRRRLGEIQFCNSVEFGGSRMVAVGGAVYAIDPKHAPLNFMSLLLVETLGESWFGEELKAAGPVHPIIAWYRDTMDWQQRHADKVGHVCGRPSGPAKAWFLLAYDVMVLQQHALLEPLLHRLRKLDQFQGARNELTTYASFVRGGSPWSAIRRPIKVGSMSNSSHITGPQASKSRWKRRAGTAKVCSASRGSGPATVHPESRASCGKPLKSSARCPL